MISMGFVDPMSDLTAGDRDKVEAAVNQMRAEDDANTPKPVF